MGYNNCIGSEDVLVGVNGNGFGVLPASCSLNKWMALYSKLPFPRLITFLRVTSEGSILFDPLKVLFLLRFDHRINYGVDFYTTEFAFASMRVTLTL